MYKHVKVSHPLHLDHLYVLFVDNLYYLKKMIVDIYSMLPANKLYEKVYFNLTNQYNGYIIYLLIDYSSPENMYKINIYNIFTNYYVVVKNDIHSICCAIHDIKYNKVPCGPINQFPCDYNSQFLYGQIISQFPCGQPVHYK